MLATAAGGVHSRNWLQDMLWGRSEPKNRQDSLRRAIADLRKIFGRKFDDHFLVNNLEVRIRLSRFELCGSAMDGEFLEGLTIAGQSGFAEWLHGQRRHSQGWVAQSEAQFALSDLPAVAVIPFEADGEGVFGKRLSDLIALEVTRSLSRSRMVNVISHLSSRRFSQKVTDLRRIKAALKIDYLIFGNLRCRQGQFELIADFIAADTGQLVWSHSYHGQVAEILNAQHPLVPDLSNRIGFGILQAAIETAKTRPLSQVSNHALMMSAIGLMHQQRLKAFSVSRKMLETLADREGNHASVHAWLGLWYLLFSAQGWSSKEENPLSIARRNVDTALQAEPINPFALTIDGMLRSEGTSDLRPAENSFDEALLHDPNNALAWIMYSRLKAFAGDGENAVRFSERAQRLSPFDPQAYLFDVMSGMCHCVNGDYARAYEYIAKSLAENPRHASTHRAKVITLQLMGKDQAARDAAKRLLSIAPDFTISAYRKSHPAANNETGQLWAEALARSGIPIN